MQSRRISITIAAAVSGITLLPFKVKAAGSHYAFGAV